MSGVSRKIFPENFLKKIKIFCGCYFCVASSVVFPTVFKYNIKQLLLNKIHDKNDFTF